MPLLIAIIAGVLVLGGAGYFGFIQYQAKIESQQKEIEANRKELEEVKKQIQENQKQTTAQASKIEKFTTASVIEYWRSRIAYVECYFKSGPRDDDYLIQSGSGVFLNSSSKNPNLLLVITNAHVASIINGKDIVRASFCKLRATGDKEFVSSKNIGFGSGIVNRVDFEQDVAGIEIENPTSFVKNIKNKFQPCLEPADIGDEIVILGYPVTGSQEEINATEGIVSSYEGHYYVTSAKIEHGNSGGAAILIKRNCDLGIPTAAVAGEIESLGRILAIDTAFYWLAH